VTSISNRANYDSAFNTKTACKRTVAITAQLMNELQQLRAKVRDDPKARVFGIENNVKRSFSGPREQMPA